MRIVAAQRLNGATFDVDVDDVPNTATRCMGMQMNCKTTAMSGQLIGYENDGAHRYVLRLPAGKKWVRIGDFGDRTKCTVSKNITWVITPDPDEHAFVTDSAGVKAIWEAAPAPTPVEAIDFKDVVSVLARFAGGTLVNKLSSTSLSRTGVLVGRVDRLDRGKGYIVKVENGHRVQQSDLDKWIMVLPMTPDVDKYLYIDPDFVDYVIAPPNGPAKAVKKREIPPHPHTCNCGSPCLMLATTTECTNAKCRWYRRG